MANMDEWYKLCDDVNKNNNFTRGYTLKRMFLKTLFPFKPPGEVRPGKTVMNVNPDFP